MLQRICFLAGLIFSVAVADGEASPRRRPLSTPRVFDQAPRVLPVDSLFHAEPAGRQQDAVPDNRREGVPRNRALDLPGPTLTTLPLNQGETGSDREREREREEERSRGNWLRPMDLLGEEDVARSDLDDRDARENRERVENREEDVLDWQSLREVMTAREQEAEDMRDRERRRDGADPGQDVQEEAVFSIRGRTQDGLGLAPVQAVGRDRDADAQTPTRPGGGMERPQPAAVLQPAMRLAPVMGSSPAAAPFEADRSRERPASLAGGDRRVPGMGAPGAPRPAVPQENRWAPREPVRTQSTFASSSPSASPIGTSPGLRNEPVLPARQSSLVPPSAPPPSAPSNPGMDIRRFRPNEFTIRPEDPRDRR